MIINQALEEVAPGGVLCKRCSLKFRKIHRKHLRQSLFFNKVAGSGSQLY